MKSYSQSGEDIAAKKIFDIIGEGRRTCVDFGAADGVWLSNTKIFRDAGWQSWLFDIEPKAPEVIRASNTASSENPITSKGKVTQVQCHRWNLLST